MADVADNGNGRVMPGRGAASMPSNIGSGSRSSSAVDRATSGGSPAQHQKPDPNLMVTAAELQRAREIREAAQESDKVDTSIKAQERHPLLPFILNPDPNCIGRLTDYDYAQCAITMGTQDLEVIVDRLSKLQAFRQEYKIMDSVEEGISLIYKLMELMPGYILSVDFAPRYGSYILVSDFAAFFPERVRNSRENMRIYMGGLYYIFKCISTNLSAVRAGVVFIAECEGTTQVNFDMVVEEKFMYELFSYFPFRHKECLWLNTPTVANLVFAQLKRAVTPEFLASWRMGCKLDGYEGRIDTLFKMPTPTVAQEQLLGRVDRFLAERHKNELDFELVDRLVMPDPPPVRAADAAANPEVPAANHQER